MKQFLLVVVLIALVYGCNTQKSVVSVTKDDEATLKDSTEYDMETFDSRFKSWYKYHDDPATYRSQDYYERWNRQYVTAWNAKCARGGKDWHFEPVVGYKQGEDYGFELNHKLFYYFMYVENVLKIKILPGGPELNEL